MSESFFEKLKKGMEIKNVPTQESKEIKTEENNPEKPQIKIKKRAKKKQVKQPDAEKLMAEKPEDKKPKIEKTESEKPFESNEKMMIKVEKEKPLPKDKTTITEKKESKNWFEPEGQLAVDVYQTNEEIVIQSAIAGVEPEDLDILIEKDMISIKGERKELAEKSGKNYFYQECYWGRFSKEIILPEEVDNSRVEAKMKNGILTIRLPKIEREKKRKIAIKE
jgi:HSP20 family protein